MPRRLDSNEKALWGRVIATVEPIQKVKSIVEAKVQLKSSPPQKRIANTSPVVARPVPLIPTAPKLENLDGHWDRRIHRGGIVPDVSIDLHDSNLSSAYMRLDRALEQAISQKLKVILLVTGKARAHDRASGQGRGAIASVVRDWLAASRHAKNIAAVRNAHPKHGGQGALYIVLKR